MSHRFFSLIKLVLIIFALVLAIFLALEENTNTIAPDQKVVFVLDINRTMNTEDMLSGSQRISRLQAAKYLIRQTLLSEYQFSYGLILFNAGVDYIIPPTFDTGTFLLYLSGITTNLLPDGNKNFTSLSEVLSETDNTSYIIISDFDIYQSGTIGLSKDLLSFPKGTSLLGLGSLAGDKVRYSNGIVYYDNGNSVFSVRNDQFAKYVGLPYTTLTSIDSFSLQKLLFRGIDLPFSQRTFLYVLLGVLVIVIVLL